MKPEQGRNTPYPLLEQGSWFAFAVLDAGASRRFGHCGRSFNAAAQPDSERECVPLCTSGCTTQCRTHRDPLGANLSVAG